MSTPSTSRPAIVQIVPRADGGVHDFAHCLQAEWAKQGVSSDVVAFDRRAARELPLHERLARLPGARSTTVLLHFSGYGYDPRAMCFWLLDELRAARRRLDERLRIVTMVHELFATGPPWRSAFWLGRLQAWLTRAMAGQSDMVWTNARHHGDWLRGAMPTELPIRVRPVFSTVGEPDLPRATLRRTDGLVVFGSPSTRARAFGRLADRVGELRKLGVASIIEVGTGSASKFEVPSLQHDHVGELSCPQISHLLQAHRFALIDYPSIYLGKSTVFAAYAAHGCVVLNTAPPGVDADGLAEGVHYVALQRASPRATDPEALAAIADAANDWYGDHTLRGQAAEFLDLLQAPVRATRDRRPCVESTAARG